jgi:exodeoxyribonuclease V alpha subunit
LAYAVSVHKSQRSEYPVVVMPVHISHYMLLQRNLLYTRVPRAKKLVIIVGTKKTLKIGIRKDKIQKRFTGLCQKSKLKP